MPFVASRRFDGAITTPEHGAPERDSSMVPAPGRRPRPLLLEFAAASLVVGGLTGVLGVVGSSGPPTPELDALFVGLDIVTIVVGLLVRAGRAWSLAINVVAVVLFLELMALPSPFAVVFSAIDTIVLFALIRHRAWFLLPVGDRPGAGEPAS